jgi:hypothetical protein
MKGQDMELFNCKDICRRWSLMDVAKSPALTIPVVASEPEGTGEDRPPHMDIEAQIAGA